MTRRLVAHRGVPAALGRAVFVLLASALLASPAYAQSRCVSAQWKSVSKLASDLTRCESKGSQKGHDADASCIAKAESKYEKGMAKAAGQADCATDVDQELIRAVAAALVTDLREGIDPGPAFCCAGSGSCLMVRDPFLCTAFGGGGLGVEGSSCDASGTCMPIPRAPGPCCESFDNNFSAVCTVDAGSVEADCTDLGGSFTADAVCTTEGRCQALTP